MFINTKNQLLNMSSSEIEYSIPVNDNKQLAEVIAKVEDLKLSSDSIEKKNERTLCIGKIQTVIDELGIMTVKPESSKTLLDFGTSVFVRQNIPGLEKEDENYALIGHVEDIFGPVNSPMYAVKSLSAECNSVCAGESLFYMNNSNTKMLTISCLPK